MLKRIALITLTIACLSNAISTNSFAQSATSSGSSSGCVRAKAVVTQRTSELNYATKVLASKSSKKQKYEEKSLASKRTRHAAKVASYAGKLTTLTELKASECSAGSYCKYDRNIKFINSRISILNKDLARAEAALVRLSTGVTEATAALTLATANLALANYSYSICS